MVEKEEKIWAFIDSQNLNLGTKENLYDKNKKLIYQGWPLDYKKFRRYLSDKFRVQKAIIFIGYSEEFKSLYKHLESYGYELIYKPTVKDSHGKLKGNVDSELVLNCAAKMYSSFDKAVIVAGDGDYRCLHEYLQEKNKLLKIVIPNQKSESSLLKPFQEYKVFIQSDRKKLEYIPFKPFAGKKK